MKARGFTIEQTVSDATDLLRRTSLLCGLDEAVFVEVAQRTTFKQFYSGAVILRPSDRYSHLTIILEGSAQVNQLAEDGRQIGTRVLKPSDFTGELSVIDQRPVTENLVAISSSVVVAFVPAPVAKQLFLHFPSVTDKMLQHLCKTIREGTQIRSLLAMNRAQARVYQLLLSFAKVSPDKKSLTIDSMPNQRTMAMLANVSRESVSRAIHVLIKQNVLRKDARKLIVISPDALVRLAKGEATQVETINVQ